MFFCIGVVPTGRHKITGGVVGYDIQPPVNCVVNYHIDY